MERLERLVSNCCSVSFIMGESGGRVDDGCKQKITGFWDWRLALG